MSADVNAGRTQKIIALLNMAEDPNLTEAARENYRNKALELMTKWEIDEARLRARGLQRTEEIITELIVIPGVPKIYADALTRMSATIIRALGARAVRYPVRGDTITVQLIAFDGDVQRLETMLLSLVRQALLDFASWTRQPDTVAVIRGYTAMQKFTYRRSFFVGFASAVHTRLMALHAEVQETEPGTALAIQDRTTLIQNFVDQMDGLRRGKTVKIAAGGISSGWAAGNRADIGQTTITNETTRVHSLGN